MMFIIRSSGEWPNRPDVEVKLSRDTPSTVTEAADKTDFFCAGEADAIPALRAAGWNVVELHDGYYEDGAGGGVAIWGQGRYWEIRDTPFTVKEASGPGGTGTDAARQGEHIEVRRAISGLSADKCPSPCPSPRPRGEGTRLRCRATLDEVT